LTSGNIQKQVDKSFGKRDHFPDSSQVTELLCRDPGVTNTGFLDPGNSTCRH